MSGPSEEQTRKQLIDPKIRAAGWAIVPFDESKSLADYDRCAINENDSTDGMASPLTL